MINLQDDFQGEPRDDKKEEGEEFIEAEENMDYLGDVIFQGRSREGGDRG